MPLAREKGDRAIEIFRFRPADPRSGLSVNALVTRCELFHLARPLDVGWFCLQTQLTGLNDVVGYGSGYSEPPWRLSPEAWPGLVGAPTGPMMRAWGLPSFTTKAGPPGLPSEPSSALVTYGP